LSAHPARYNTTAAIDGRYMADVPPTHRIAPLPSRKFKRRVPVFNAVAGRRRRGESGAATVCCFEMMPPHGKQGYDVAMFEVEKGETGERRRGERR